MRARESSFGLLALLIGAVAILWLAAACGGEACEKVSSLQERSMISKEFARFLAEIEDKPMSERERNLLWIEASFEKEERLRPERDRIEAIIDRHELLIRRQPNISGYGVQTIVDENGYPTDAMFIHIGVTEKVDQSTLPPEDRIPDCLEGVPVQFVVEGLMYQE